MPERITEGQKTGKPATNFLFKIDIATTGYWVCADGRYYGLFEVDNIIYKNYLVFL